MDRDLECIVIGAGVAGLGAALVLGRARRRTLLLDSGGQSNRAAAHVGGLLAQEGTAPEDLYARGREQLGVYESVGVRDADAVDVRADGDGFVVALEGGEERATRTVVVATGADYEVPDVPGFRDNWGGAVFHCPFCHGWEVRDRPLVVYGDGPGAEHQAALALGWSADVTRVATDEFAELLVEDGAVRAVRRRDGSEVPCEGILVQAPPRPRSDLAARLGAQLSDDGFVVADAIGRTSVPGVYAAGDVAQVPQQVAIALGSGHLAGVSAVRELLLGRDEPSPA